MIPALAAFGLSGCTDYISRKETVMLSTGDAVQTSFVTHVRDPWPTHARNKNIAFDGERMQRVIQRYRTYDPSPPAPPSIVINTGGGGS